MSRRVREWLRRSPSDEGRSSAHEPGSAVPSWTGATVSATDVSRSMLAPHLTIQSNMTKARAGWRQLATAIGLLALVGGSAPWASAAAAAQTPTVSPGFGAYVGPADPSALTAIATQTGTSPSFASDYLDDRSWGRMTDDGWLLGGWSHSHYGLVLGVPMLPRGSSASLAMGATGAYDKYFRVIANELVAAGFGDATIRLGWEFNVSSQPWYAAGQSSSFVAYWRQIVKTMRDVTGSSFHFEWNPNIGDSGPGDARMGSFADYYPGDAFVDIVALDVYDVSWSVYPGAAAEFQHLTGEHWGLTWLANFAQTHQRELAIGEFGLGEGLAAVHPGLQSGGDDPVFIADLIGWARRHDAVNFVLWDVGRSACSSSNNPLAFRALVSSLQ